VEGHLTDDAVEELLAKIESLPFSPRINEYNEAVHREFSDGNNEHREDINGIKDTEIHPRDINGLRRGDN
jgi:hypothetical protein